MDERLVFIIALFVTAFGFFALLPMGNEFPKVAISSESLQSLSNSVTPFTQCVRVLPRLANGNICAVVYFLIEFSVDSVSLYSTAKQRKEYVSK